MPDERGEPALPDTPGAYVLVIDLARPLRLDIARRPPVVLPAGRYAYCGSACGPGGLRARVARHRRRGKTPHWHVDRLSEAGRVAAVHAVPGARECDLLARLLEAPGVTVPLPGFGSSDCRRCPAHLVALPQRFDASRLAPALP